MRIEEAADRLFEASHNRSDKSPMSRLIASELIHNAILRLATQGPLDDHDQNDSTLNAVQVTLQELQLLDIGAEKALLQLSKGAKTGLYSQLLEIQRNYAKDASSYFTREQIAAIAAQTVVDDSRTVDTKLAQHLLIVKVPAAPNAYTRLCEALQNLPVSITLNVSIPVKNSRSYHSSERDIRGIKGNDIARSSQKSPSQEARERPLSSHHAQDANHADVNRDTRFYSAMGAVDETRSLIRNIMSDARNGIRFGEMAVLYPTGDYSTRIRDALNDAGIKSCGPSIKTLNELPAGRFVTSFLTMLTKEIRRDVFTAWISSSPVIDPSNGQRVPYVPWEVVSRNAKISRFSGETEWRRALERYSNRMRRRDKQAAVSVEEQDISTNPQSFIQAADSAIQLRDFVVNLVQKIQNEHLNQWADWVGWLEEIIKCYLAPQNKRSKLELSGVDCIQDALKRVSDLDHITNMQVDFDRFRRTIQRLIRTKIGGSSGWGAAVLVAPIDACSGVAFKSVHILGMTEGGGLPGPGRYDPLLPDNLKKQLDQHGTRLLTKNDHLKLDQQIFQMALSAAPKTRLYWNKALLGATNESYPSPWFVTEVQKSHDQTNVPVQSLMETHSEYVESTPTLSELHTANIEASSEYELGLRDIAIRARTPSDRSSILKDPSFAVLADGHALSSSRRSKIFGPFDGYVADSRINKLSAWSTSANALGNYAKCPYSYFLAHELNVDERIDPEESLNLSTIDRGVLVHSILEQYFKLHGVDSSTQGRQALRDIANKVFDRFQKDEFIGYNAIFDLEKVQILRNLDTWHRTQLSILEGYENELLTERSFGYDDSELGILTLDDGFTIRLQGKIDLIAISTDRDSALVFDFKTGNSNYSNIEKDVTDSGTNLQLPIYSIVASEILGDTSDIQAAFWLVFVNGNKRLRPIKKVKLKDALDAFNPVLKTIVDGVRSGVFPVRPGNVSDSNWENCKYCPYTDVCTSDRLSAWNRKKSNPVLKSYFALAEPQSQ